ncbi:SusD/RagB family nutrient-binding outer membrane lipoprotein [Myroides fluvii]|uniref:SusD/RagB family nutrient-binding outer membrane lipoprotein n=1 Tax=Myroides fluvii TaxID=2572594 RepID=UPI00131B1AA3|nr:SusD/RagB family nutrient-binding outer membrane lipoprotein [Myroides fluvii]
MKRIKYILASIVVAALALQSCSEDKMDDINKNKNDPEFMESKFILTEVMTKTGFSITGGDLAFYASIYTELLGGTFNQFYNAQERLGEPSASTTYNNQWNAIYVNLRSLKLVEQKCSAGGEEAGNYHTLGVAQILKAYNLALLTDLFGDVPYSEALEPLKNPQAKIDRQEDIYKAVFQLLDDGIENLAKKSEYPNLGKQDLVYTNGDVTSWTKAAYGLKARYLMRMSLKNPDYQGVIDNVDKSFTFSEGDFKYQVPGVNYPFYLVYRARKGMYASKTYYDLMQKLDTADPRLNDYFIKVGKDDPKVVLVDHAKDVTQSQSVYSPSALSYSTATDLKNATNAVYLMSYHELLFLKAEAQARLGIPQANATLQAAVDAGYLDKKQSITYVRYVPKPNEPKPINGYNRNLPTNLAGDDLLKRIAQEKYLSAFEVESIEMYNDIRRWKAMGENLIELQHKDPAKFPKRFSYGNSDVSNNPHVRAAYGDGNYVYTDDVWWAGGTR